MGLVRGRLSTYLFLGLDGTLQEGLDARLEVLDLLALEALELVSHQATHVLEQQPGLMGLLLGVTHAGRDFVQFILLAPALPQQFVVSIPLLLQF